jgi:glycosyltransferase involved in cell wall biosynthesis
MFWTTAADLALALAAAESDRPALGTKNSAAIERVAERYSWDAVTAAYEEMCLELAGRAAHGVAGRTARS